MGAVFGCDVETMEAGGGGGVKINGCVTYVISCFTFSLNSVITLFYWTCILLRLLF